MKFYRRNILGGIAVTAAILFAQSASSWTHGSAGQTQLPLTGNLVFKLSADSITGLSNGASLTTSSWVDSQNSIAVNSITGTGPTFRTNQVGGKPSVRFGGSGIMGITSAGILATTIDSQVYTILIAAKTITSSGTDPDSIFAAAVAGGGINFQYYSNGVTSGRFDNGQDHSATYAGTSFFSLGSIEGGGLPTFNTDQWMLNGTSYFSTGNNVPTTNGHPFSLGGLSDNTNDWNGDIFEVLVWNVALTPAQYMQAEKWLCDKYGQPYPWAGMAKFPVFWGDSFTAGVGATGTAQGSIAANTPAYLTAQSLGLTYGQYQALGIGGISTTQMTAMTPTYINPIAAQFGGKIGVITWEWANDETATTTDGAAFLAALKAGTNVQTVFGTSSSSTNYDPSTNRATFDSAWDAIWAGAKTNIDSYMPIHTDAHIGVNGSYATYSTPTGGDGLHLTNATYPYLAAIYVTGFQALP